MSILKLAEEKTLRGKETETKLHAHLCKRLPPLVSLHFISHTEPERMKDFLSARLDQVYLAVLKMLIRHEEYELLRSVLEKCNDIPENLLQECLLISCSQRSPVPLKLFMLHGAKVTNEIVEHCVRARKFYFIDLLSSKDVHII